MSDTFRLPELEQLFSASANTPAVRSNQLARRQPPNIPDVVTQQELAVIEERQIQEQILTQRERLNKRGVETKAECILHANAVFTEMASEMVTLKNSIADEETRFLSASFTQFLLSDTPDEFKQVLTTGLHEVDRVVETNLQQEAQRPTVEHRQLTWRERWDGVAEITRD